jgi:hypothetical protein
MERKAIEVFHRVWLLRPSANNERIRSVVRLPFSWHDGAIDEVIVVLGSRVDY